MSADCTPHCMQVTWQPPVEWIASPPRRASPQRRAEHRPAEAFIAGMPPYAAAAAAATAADSAYVASTTVRRSASFGTNGRSSSSGSTRSSHSNSSGYGEVRAAPNLPPRGYQACPPPRWTGDETDYSPSRAVSGVATLKGSGFVTLKGSPAREQRERAEHAALSASSLSPPALWQRDL